MRRETLVRTVQLLLCLVAVLLPRHAARACPYCSLMGSTITLDVENSQIVFVGSVQDDGTFHIDHFLKGEELLQESPEGLRLESTPRNVPVLVFGNQLEGGSFEWQETRTIGSSVFQYLVGALAALAQEPTDIAYFYPMLGHERTAIADDAFYQFARADYSILEGAKEHFDVQRLIEMISSPNTMPELRELAFKLLGMVGTESDAHLPLAEIESADAGSRRKLENCHGVLFGIGRRSGTRLAAERVSGKRRLQVRIHTCGR